MTADLFSPVPARYAVMSHRSEASDSLDDFPTPPWATRALCQHVLKPSGLQTLTAWEPACNRGHMVRPLREYFATVLASDIMDYGFPDSECCDFLAQIATCEDVDWIITNPPFRLAEQFIIKARRIASQGVAVIVRTAFLESVGRYTNLFRDNPPSIIAQFTERVVMVKGRLDQKGSTATAYCWLVWCDTGPSRFVWIPPCRKNLEKEGDYL